MKVLPALKLVDIDESGVYYRATMETLVSQYDDHVEIEAYRRLAQSNFLKLGRRNQTCYGR